MTGNGSDWGYRYSCNGAQINRPEDEGIAQSIRENLEPWQSAWAELQSSDILHADAYENLIQPYESQVKDYAVSSRSKVDGHPLKATQVSTVTEWKSPQPFVYTPLHGVGGLVLPELCQSLGVENFVSVPLQVKPDPEFPTVKFPNPEEAGALDLAIETADKEGRTLIIANDPDADRFAVAEKVELVNPFIDLWTLANDHSGKWFLFTGNHVGALLASHVLDSLERKKDLSAATFLTTTVSSGMLEKMAVSKGALFQETLTGFKWMGNVARDLEKTGRNVPFAYEEALGYMFPSVCYDKDGITAASVFLAAYTKWQSQGLTAFGKLQQLFAEYGHHETLNNYFRSPNPALTTELFSGIRSGSFPADMQFGQFKILRWRDMTDGYDSATPDRKPDLPEDASSQMLTLWLEGGVRFTMRGSGTEPKVKCKFHNTTWALNWAFSRAEEISNRTNTRLLVYIESCGASRDDAINAVCETFLTIAKEWVLKYTPSMTHSNQLSTSSGHVLHVE